MALKRRRDHAEMWKECFNFYFMVIISGLMYLILLVTSEPVCYTRVSLDEHNRYWKRVDCDGTDKICHWFASSEDVNLVSLLDSPCGYPEDYSFTRENTYKEITCLTTNLPSITDGSFDCAAIIDVSMGEVCALSCNDGFYVAYSNQVVCEAGTNDQEGKWSEGNFACRRVITCQEVHLPTVNSGFFNCSGYSVGDKCNLTCDDGYYPSATRYTICEEYDDHKANWTVGEFQCSVLTCQEVHLRTVNSGFFNCSGYYVGGKCNLTCDDGYYPSATQYTFCEEYDDHKANWTVGEFKCSVSTCQDGHLPTVNRGFFNCSGYSVRSKCNLTCDYGYFPSSTKYTVCEENDDHKANWTVGEFQCSAIKCFITNLPTVNKGFLECADDLNLSMGEACNLTCNQGLYPAYSRQAVCVAGTSDQGGAWSTGSFVCQRLECSEWNAWNGSEYKYINTEQNWDESGQLCESENSHLVTINNKEENDFVHKLAGHCGQNRGYAWIGLTDRGTGVWEWSEGTVSTYRNWAEVEPNGQYSRSCGFMSRDTGEWHDFHCTEHRYGIEATCERNNPLA